jgi:hypothetical protein
MPRRDQIVPASSSTALANEAFILDEIGVYPQSQEGIIARVVGECMAARLSRLCMEGAAAHLRNK